MFYLLSFTADEFLSPSLDQLSKTFKLSESLAGVTLLAFGGGAPDVFTSLTAIQGGEFSGIEMGIATLIGSSLFILAIVSAGVIMSSPGPIKLNKSFFARDTFFLNMGLIILLYAIAVRGCIDILMSVLFLGLYVVYVVTVFYQDHAHEAASLSQQFESAQKKISSLDNQDLFSGLKGKNSNSFDDDIESGSASYGDKSESRVDRPSNQ